MSLLDDCISSAIHIFVVRSLSALADVYKRQVVVAAATGAVGSVVGQIAKLKGCHIVGIAGGERKCRSAVEDLGFDACIDHRDPAMKDLLCLLYTSRCV